MSGLRVLVLSNMYPGPADPDYGAFVARMAEAMENAGAVIDVASIDSRASGPIRTPAKYAGLARRAAKRAREVDVVYAHYLFPTGAVAAAARWAGGAPWVVTAHGRDVRNLARRSVRAPSARALSNAAAVITVSRYLAAELRKTGMALPPVHTINMGVDLDRFRPRDRAAARLRLRLSPRGPVIVAVGGLTHRKNPLTLLQAFSQLRAARPDARLVFVGDGPLAGAIDAGVERLALGASVIGAGVVPPSDVADWIDAADALAMVSTVEPLGVVALEALASGRPVVATRVGGAAEVVPDRGPGRIVDPRDPSQIATALSDLLISPPSVASCRRVAEGHGLARQAERVLDLLGTVARTTT